jgi:hypothetical protein
MTLPGPPDRPPAPQLAARQPTSRDRAARIDESVAHAGRMYDFMLGGTTNYPVDREAAAHAGSLAPGGIEGTRAGIRANRRFLGRVVRHLAADVGMRQFLDIGTGIPNADNTHAVALGIAPDARVVYVDNDPIVLAHAYELLDGTAGVTDYIDGDIRHPEKILREAARTLDFTQPVAVMLVAILHFVSDEEGAYEIVRQLLDAVAPGSYVAISHLASDVMADEMSAAAERANRRTQETFVLRSRAEVAHFFDGLELVEPGVVMVDQWPDVAAAPAATEAAMMPFYAALGRRPA